MILGKYIKGYRNRMSKKIIKIDSEKCIGCGICADTCQQSAIEMVDGKAVVTSESFCDGIGNCLPVCPVNAISFSDKDIVENADNSRKPQMCPGSLQKKFDKRSDVQGLAQGSALRQWPVQIKLVPESAPYYDNADLLIAADCSAYAYANFHMEFMKDKTSIIGCPKLDGVDYTDKLAGIIKNNAIRSVTVVRMEVPCCTPIANAAVKAVKTSGKNIDCKVVTLGVDGKILSR